MKRYFNLLRCLLVPVAAGMTVCAYAQNVTSREEMALKYNNPDLTVDLGVGLWGIPLPVDYNGDGLTDLVVSCPDRPYKGLYLFMNIGAPDAPMFDKAVKLSDKGRNNIKLSQAGGSSIGSGARPVTPDRSGSTGTGVRSRVNSGSSSVRSGGTSTRRNDSYRSSGSTTVRRNPSTPSSTRSGSTTRSRSSFSSPGSSSRPSSSYSSGFSGGSRSSGSFSGGSRPSGGGARRR